MGSVDGRRLPSRLTVVKSLAVTVPVLLVVGVGWFLGTASAAEPCAGACGDDPVADHASATAYPDPATVTVYPDPATVYPDPATVTVYPSPATVYPSPATVTETTTVVVKPNPATVTVRVPVPATTVTVPTTVSVPTTVRQLATATATHTVTGQGSGRQDADGLATSTEFVPVTDRTTETALEKVFLTDQVTNTVTVTRYTATRINRQTGQTPAVTINAAQVSPGGSLILSGSGLTPNEDVTMTLHSAPVLLKTVKADSQGDFQTVVTIPADTALGKHTIHVVGVTCGVETIVPLTVVAPSSGSTSDDSVGDSNPFFAGQAQALGNTGFDVGSAGAVAAMLIGCGLALMVIARQRLRVGRHRA